MNEVVINMQDMLVEMGFTPAQSAASAVSYDVEGDLWNDNSVTLVYTDDRGNSWRETVNYIG